MYNTAAIVTTQLNHGGKFSGKEFSNSSTTNPGPGEESGKRFKRFRSRHHRVPSADQPSTLKGFLVPSKVSILGVESLLHRFSSGLTNGPILEGESTQTVLSLEAIS